MEARSGCNQRSDSKCFQDEIRIAPLSDSVINPIVGNPDPYLVEEAAEVVGKFDHFTRMVGGDVNHQAVLELRLVAAFSALNGKTGRQSSDPDADARVFDRIDLVPAV